MINLKSNKNQKTNETRLVQILFYTFPLWFIVGNLAVSLHSLLFIVVSLFVIQRKQLTPRFNNLYWLLVAFFLYFFLSTTIQFLSPGLLNEKIQNWPLENNPIFKSFALMRFLILIFVIDTLFFNQILNLKKFFLFSLFCTSFVSFDIILQYVTGFDLFGYKRMGSWNSGPFGDEWIAGAYLKNFSFFSFFYVFNNLKNKNFNNSLLVLIIVFHITAVLLAGNKMPMILFLFGCGLIILLIKNFRSIMFLSIIIFFSIFFILVKNDTYYKTIYSSFSHEIVLRAIKKIHKDIKKQVSQKIESKENEGSLKNELPSELIFLKRSDHNRIFRASLKMWKEKPLFGFGLKSFRIKCWDMLSKDNAERKITLLTWKSLKIPRPQKIACANHSHNYYLELLSETGIIGTCLLIIFFLIVLKDSLIYLKKYNQQKNPEMNLLIPVVIVFFLEIWPIKSTGSFFTTWGATFFWLNVAMLIAIKERKSL